MIGQIVFRLVLLFVVSYLGAVVFYSRREFAPRALLTLCVRRSGVVCLWTLGAFFVMTLVEWAFINS